jgi:heat shock protein HtpX
MNLYSQIWNNKVRTFLTFVLFSLLTFAFFAVVGQMVGFRSNAYIIVSIVFTLGSAFTSYFFSDKMVLASVGAKIATKAEYFNLYTVCENLTMAAGMPMPKVYVMQDDAPNAFATGRNPKNAVVCVSTGLLAIMDRSELEGVIAHELSHIKNYDILLSTVVGAMAGVISTITNQLMWITSFGGINNDEENNNSPFAIIGYIVALLLIPAVLFLVQMAISRRREYQADASGALITRYPEGLARALEKLQRNTIASPIATAGNAHLFISDPFKRNRKFISWAQNLLSTHPPLEDRIRILRGL